MIDLNAEKSDVSLTIEEEKGMKGGIRNMAEKIKNMHVKLCMMILSESGW